MYQYGHSLAMLNAHARSLKKKIEALTYQDLFSFLRSLAQAKRLMEREEEDLSPEEETLLRLLVSLIEQYEDKHYPVVRQPQPCTVGNMHFGKGCQELLVTHGVTGVELSKGSLAHLLQKGQRPAGPPLMKRFRGHLQR